MTMVFARGPNSTVDPRDRTPKEADDAKAGVQVKQSRGGARGACGREAIRQGGPDAVRAGARKTGARPEMRLKTISDATRISGARPPIRIRQPASQQLSW
jgi:hypothetical protein